jgi:hypothetical protein
MAKVTSAPEGIAQDEVDANVSRMIGLIEELIAVIGDENRLLATGVPASLSSSVALKATLAMRLESWAADVHTKPLMLEMATPQMRESLVERTQMLSGAMEENINRIKSAIDATGSRVNAIMSAIREQAETDASYRANGTVGLARPAAAANGRLA